MAASAVFFKGSFNGIPMSAERDLADFESLRDASMVVLLDMESEGTADLTVIRTALARSEWSRIDPDRRFWALGHCAGDAADFDEVREVVHLGWEQLAPGVQEALTERILDWIRARVTQSKAVSTAPKETQAASEGTGPAPWDVETKSM